MNKALLFIFLVLAIAGFHNYFNLGNTEVLPLLKGTFETISDVGWFSGELIGVLGLITAIYFIFVTKRKPLIKIWKPISETDIPENVMVLLKSNYMKGDWWYTRASKFQVGFKQGGKLYYHHLGRNAGPKEKQNESRKKEIVIEKNVNDRNSIVFNFEEIEEDNHYFTHWCDLDD